MDYQSVLWPIKLLLEQVPLLSLFLTHWSSRSRYLFSLRPTTPYQPWVYVHIDHNQKNLLISTYTPSTRTYSLWVGYWFFGSVRHHTYQFASWAEIYLSRVDWIPCQVSVEFSSTSTKTVNYFDGIPLWNLYLYPFFIDLTTFSKIWCLAYIPALYRYS